jgi:Ohr subfamily peroxiredoxin
MNLIEKTLYTAETTVTGGREGTAKSTDGALDIQLSTPKSLGGTGGNGTNPEQLFAAGYSACFIGALKVVAAAAKVKLANDIYVDARVHIGPVGNGFGIAAELDVCLQDLDKETAQALVEKAHEVCPYSNATRNNISVTLNVI